MFKKPNNSAKNRGNNNNIEEQDFEKDIENNYLSSEDEKKYYESFLAISRFYRDKIELIGKIDYKAETDRHYVTPYEKILEDLKFMILRTKRKIHEKVEGKKIKKEVYFDKYSCSNYLNTVYKDLENFFHEKGLTDEANEMYYLMNKEKTEILKYEKKILDLNFVGKSKYFFNLAGRWIWEQWFGFFVRPWKIFWCIVLGILGFSFFYWILGSIGYLTNDTIDHLNSHTINELGHCIYFSIVTITNLGSEVHIPLGFIGRFFQCFEAIIGYGILGFLNIFFPP